ncbi:MAG: hypothetical protein ACI9XP_000249 [Lentimonas sp.]|jgi:hypothetical protein
MKLFITLITVFAFTVGASAQNPGYFGKKNYLSIDAGIFARTGYRILGDDPHNSTNSGDFEKYSRNINGKEFTNSKFVDKGRQIPVQFNISIGRQLSRSFSLFFNSNIRSTTFTPTSDFQSPSGYGASGVGSAMKARTIVFGPSIQFSQSSSILPIGYSFLAGFGIGKTAITSNEVYIRESYSFYNENTFENEDVVTYTKVIVPTRIESVTTVRLNVKPTLTFAINQFVMYHIGFDYQLNIITENGIAKTNIEDKFYINDLKQRLANNFLSFNAGLTFAF